MMHPRLLGFGILALATTGLLACPQELPGRAPAGGPKVKVRRIEDGAAPTKSEAHERQGKALQATSKARHVDAMRLALVKPEEGACKVDSDCALLSNHCCSCERKGRLVGVSRAHVPKVIQRRGWVCEDYRCPEVMSDDPSCQAKQAVCRAGRCEPDIPEGAKETQGFGVEPIDDAAATP